jgi:uncharacterized membrane protein
LLLSFLLVRLARWLGVLGIVTGAVSLLLLTRATSGFAGWTILWGIGIVAACTALTLCTLGAFPLRRGIRLYAPPDLDPRPAPRWRDRAELFVYCLAGTAAALLVFCELVYLRDVFSGTAYMRMNTVFKLYYQAWLLAGLAAGPVVVWLTSAAVHAVGPLLAKTSNSIAMVAAPTPEYAAASAVSTGTLVAGGASSSGERRGMSNAEDAECTETRGEHREEPTTEGVEEGQDNHNGTRSWRERGSSLNLLRTSLSSAFSALDMTLLRALPMHLRSRFGVGEPEASGLGRGSLLRWLRASGIVVWMAAGAALLAAALVYPVLATSARTDNFTLSRTLDGAAYMATDALNAGDEPAIEWLNTHVVGDPVIVEAAKYDEYTHLGRISAFTGLPTLLGWGGHEVQWRLNWLAEAGHANVISERLDAVNAIYTSADAQTVLRVMRQYSVQLIYVGAAERGQYPTADLTRFGRFLRVVYARDGVTIYAAPSFQGVS